MLNHGDLRNETDSHGQVSTRSRTADVLGFSRPHRISEDDDVQRSFSGRRGGRSLGAVQHFAAGEISAFLTASLTPLSEATMCWEATME